MSALGRNSPVRTSTAGNSGATAACELMAVVGERPCRASILRGQSGGATVRGALRQPRTRRGS